MSLKELGYKLSDLSDVNLFDDQEANKLIKRYRYEFPFNSLDINTWFFDKELEVAPYKINKFKRLLQKALKDKKPLTEKT